MYGHHQSDPQPWKNRCQYPTLGLGFGVLSINALATHATHVNGTAELDIHRHFTWKEAGHHQPSRLSLPLESKTVTEDEDSPDTCCPKLTCLLHSLVIITLYGSTCITAFMEFCNSSYFRYLSSVPMPVDSTGTPTKSCVIGGCSWLRSRRFIAITTSRTQSPRNLTAGIVLPAHREPLFSCTVLVHPIHECTGTSPVRPLLFEFLDEKELLGINKQFLIYNHEVVNATSGGNTSFSVPLGHINVHVRDGVAILLHEEPAYTIEETRQGPYSPLVSLSSDSFASGSAYIDDGVTAPPTPNTTLAFSVSESRLVIAPIGNFNASQRPRSWM